MSISLASLAQRLALQIRFSESRSFRTLRVLFCSHFESLLLTYLGCHNLEAADGKLSAHANVQIPEF